VPETLRDSACAYTAILRLLRRDTASRPHNFTACAGVDSPLFRLHGRGHTPRAVTVTTDDMRDYARRIAGAAGLQSADVGGHSFCIGGATDLADAGGTAEQLKARGRWDGEDIGWIYARDTVGQQIQTADTIAAAQSVSLEEILAGWAQPAR